MTISTIFSVLLFMNRLHTILFVTDKRSVTGQYMLVLSVHSEIRGTSGHLLDHLGDNQLDISAQV